MLFLCSFLIILQSATSLSVQQQSDIAQRRDFLTNLGAAVAGSLTWSPSLRANAAETIGKDESCNNVSCLGVWDGMLANCPRNVLGAGCVASQDDTPGVFAEPWDYSEADSLNWEDQMRRLAPIIQKISAKRGDDTRIELQQGRYLRIRFVDGKTNEVSIGEFYFTPNDTTVQYRIGSTGTFGLVSMKNMDRAEHFRKGLGYLKLPVLRNRRRTLLFVESDLDSFGPGSALLGPPAEMRAGELEGRGSDYVDPRMKIDFLQGFPRGP